MFTSMERIFDADDKIGTLWCSLMHDSPMWPIHGHYECRICGRKYPVPWSDTTLAGAQPARQPARQPAVPRWGSAVLPVLLLAAIFAPSGFAAEGMAVNSYPPAALALARFAANPDAARWPVETVEIEASLPKLAKTGRLRAIRRLLPGGHPEYQVLESGGDPAVKKQVIVRYVSADERVTEVPAASVAITAENYKIRYEGMVRLNDRSVFVFRIVPRKKREGLINGVLWLDRETGIAVRQTGRLVKSPSIFLKHVDVTRESELHDGAVDARITHVSIDTRLVGRAELVITERPAAGPVSGDLAEPGANAAGR